MKGNTKLLFFYNLGLVLLVLVGWTVMVFFGEQGTLSTLGLANMRYFTVLSNVFAGVAALLLAVRLRRSGDGNVPHRLFVLKFLAAVTVAVTFLVVALFFGPWVGWLSLYRGGNFWFHLVIPLAVMGEFVFLDRFDGVSRRETLLAPLPALVYGIAYAVNVIVNGPGEPPDGNDFYGFVHWGLPVGFGIFAGILVTSWAAGALLRRGNRAGRRTGAKTEE